MIGLDQVGEGVAFAVDFLVVLVTLAGQYHDVPLSTRLVSRNASSWTTAAITDQTRAIAEVVFEIVFEFFEVAVTQRAAEAPDWFSYR